MGSVALLYDWQGSSCECISETWVPHGSWLCNKIAHELHSQCRGFDWLSEDKLAAFVVVMLTLIYHKCAVPQCFYPWTWWKHTDFVMHFSEHILCLNPGRNDDPSVLVNSSKFLFSPLRQRHMIKPISPFSVMGHRLIVLEQTYSLPPQNLYSFKVSFLKCMIQTEPQGSSYRDENEVYW